MSNLCHTFWAHFLTDSWLASWGTWELWTVHSTVIMCSMHYVNACWYCREKTEGNGWLWEMKIDEEHKKVVMGVRTGGRVVICRTLWSRFVMRRLSTKYIGCNIGMLWICTFSSLKYDLIVLKNSAKKFELKYFYWQFYLGFLVHNLPTTHLSSGAVLLIVV